MQASEQAPQPQVMIRQPWHGDDWIPYRGSDTINGRIAPYTYNGARHFTLTDINGEQLLLPAEEARRHTQLDLTTMQDPIRVTFLDAQIHDISPAYELDPAQVMLTDPHHYHEVGWLPHTRRDTDIVGPFTFPGTTNNPTAHVVLGDQYAGIRGNIYVLPQGVVQWHQSAVEHYGYDLRSAGRYMEANLRQGSIQSMTIVSVHPGEDTSLQSAAQGHEIVVQHPDYEFQSPPRGMWVNISDGNHGFTVFATTYGQQARSPRDGHAPRSGR